MRLDSLTLQGCSMQSVQQPKFMYELQLSLGQRLVQTTVFLQLPKPVLEQQNLQC